MTYKRFIQDSGLKAAFWLYYISYGLLLISMIFKLPLDPRLGLFLNYLTFIFIAWAPSHVYKVSFVEYKEKIMFDTIMRYEDLCRFALYSRIGLFAFICAGLNKPLISMGLTFTSLIIYVMLFRPSYKHYFKY